MSEWSDEFAAIRDELNEINELISENLQLLDLNPFDNALKLNLATLKKRQSHLIEEIVNLRKVRELETYDFCFEGEKVMGTSVSLGFIGKTMAGIQDVVDALANKKARGDHAGSKISADIKNRSELLLVGTAAGSFRFYVGGNGRYIDEPLYREALRQLNDMIDCRDDKQKIREKRKQIGPRAFNKYKGLLKVLNENNTGIKMYQQYGKEYVTPNHLNREETRKIWDVLEEIEKMPEEKVVKLGHLTGIVNSKTFHFKMSDGQSIHGELAKHITGMQIKDVLNIGEITIASRATLILTTEYKEVDDVEINRWILIDIEPSSD
jgi:hypothetical protein